MDSIFLRGKLCLHPHLLSPGCWVTHLSTAVAWREKNSKHFVSCKYFCLILGLLKSRISPSDIKSERSHNEITIKLPNFLFKDVPMPIPRKKRSSKKPLPLSLSQKVWLIFFLVEIATFSKVKLHHMLIRFLNLRNVLCFVYIHGGIFLLRSKMLI